MQRCDVYIESKAIGHKFYGYLYALSIPIYRWKDLSMYFVTRPPISEEWNQRNRYNVILVIVNWPAKMVYYIVNQTTMTVADLVEIIMDNVV